MLEQMKEQATSTNLLHIILKAVKDKGGVSDGDLVHKLMSFGVGKLSPACYSFLSYSAIMKCCSCNLFFMKH
jgi:hypothetical protein